MEDRLYRSRADRMIAGVAGGLAERYDIDPSLVRIGWALLILVTGGLFFLLYIVMAIVVPEEPYDMSAPVGPVGTEAPMTQPTPATDPATAGTDASPSPAPAPAAGGSTGWAASGPTPATGAAPAMSAREARRAARGERRDSNAPLIFGAILVIVGILAFAGQVVPGLDWDVLWPIVLVIIGGALIVAAMRRRPSA